MALEHGQDGPVQPTQYLTCVGCGGVPRESIVAEARGEPCPHCGSSKGYVRHEHVRPEQRIAARWPDAMAGGWTPMPNVFYDHVADLGLDALDVGLLDAMEARRRTADDAFTERIKRIARRLSVSEKTVRTRINKWCDLGLCEKRPTKSRHGKGNWTNEITRHGLTAALAYIAEHREWDQDAHEWIAPPGLVGFLARLAHNPRQEMPHPPASPAAPPGTTCRAEVEAVEEEADRQELLTERDSGNPDFSERSPDLRLVTNRGAA